ncbi:MAG: OmpH family outer membrane protein [Ignavibacteriae bacterium]|nr:OmpH family outer membrane protein [Ignavibacteriota bacterium]
MKRIALALLMALCATIGVAQMKIGHINSETIMQNLPEAVDAQKSLDALVASWESELQKMQAEWKKKFDDYDKRKLILTDQSRAEAEKELRDLDQAIADYRNKKFGQNGELFTKQNEVMKPIQNKIFKVLEEVAKEDSYDYVFDKSGDILLLYATEKHDLTERVLRRMQSFGK